MVGGIYKLHQYIFNHIQRTKPVSVNGCQFISGKHVHLVNERGQWINAI